MARRCLSVSWMTVGSKSPTPLTMGQPLAPNAGAPGGGSPQAARTSSGTSNAVEARRFIGSLRSQR